MKFLLDTNVLIPAEPTGYDGIEPTTRVITRLIGQIHATQCSAFLHPASIQELKGDQDVDRKEMRSLLIEKYQVLPAAPTITPELDAKLGSPAVNTHSYIDNLLIAAVVANAVSYLVTNDQQIHRKADRVGVKSRVLYPSDALVILNGFLPQDILPPPSVKLVYCHELDTADPIFDSVREDYKGFDDWLAKCQQEHRQAFLVERDGLHGAIAILKDESPRSTNKTLKICTFKVAENARGFKFGELLLKTIFDYAISNNFERTYCTCFPKQHQLLELLSDFGFQLFPTEEGGEFRVEKSLVPKQNEQAELMPLEFHIKFGPGHFVIPDDVFVVPIEPRYHRLLFPEMEQQVSFLAGQTPFGNSIRKAYLCHSPTKVLPPGSILLFYRSNDFRNIKTIGVVESSLRSNDGVALVEFVGQRTVYSKREVEEMAAQETLAILFRQVLLNCRIKIDDLIAAGVLIAPPQSITKLKPQAVEWIRKTLGR